MSVAVLSDARQAREIAAVEAILADVNRGAMPTAARDALDRQVRRRRGRTEFDQARLVYVWPTAEKVAALARYRGFYAVRERWFYVPERELSELARASGARLTREDQA